MNGKSVKTWDAAALEKAWAEATEYAAKNEDRAHVWWVPQLLAIIRELEAEIEHLRDELREAPWGEE